MGQIPPTRYAKNGEVSLAYQVFGDGPNVLAIPPGAQDIEVAWERPEFRYMFEGLGSFCRFAHFDKRGTGASDRSAGLASFDERVDDAIAVMDAAEMPSAWLWGVSEGGPMSVVAAASHPERVEGIILCNSGATLVDADESPEDRAGRREMWELFLERWGTEQSITLDVFAPSIARDESYRRWQPRYERRSASPGALRELLEMHERIDVRAVAPTVSVPTLVLHRVGDRVQPIASGRRLAALIPGATFVELPGDDHFDHIGDVDALLGEIQRFVTGGAGIRNTTRVLASVVFTDMVASTERAASLGDGRWRALINAHEAGAREVVGAHGGRYVKSTGDGTLAWFDSPSRAINATGELLERASGVGLMLRAGIHAGEIELFGDDVTGIGVNIAARILSTAAAGEVLVSRTVRDLVTGSTHRFEDRGEHELKGIEDSWQLFAVRSR